MKAVCCDTCDIWFHKTCVSMLSTEYSELNSVDNWFCYRCDSHNCDTFHAYEYSIPTSNSFSVLTPAPDDVFSSPIPQTPKAHSSPHGTVPTAAAHIPSYSRSTISSFGVSTNSQLPPNSPSGHSINSQLPSKDNNWRTLVININSIFGKSAAFEHMLSYIKPDCVIITESKLKSDINTAEVLPSNLGYTVYRKDRNRSDLSEGGGVILLIKSCYPSTDVTPSEVSKSCELIS